MQTIQNQRVERRQVRAYQIILVFSGLACFLWVAVDTIWKLRIDAERTHVAWMVGSLKSAMGIEISQRAVRGGMSDILAMEFANPVEWLAMKPSNYLGEADQPEILAVKPRTWYFNTSSRQLIYTIAEQDAFYFPVNQTPQLRFMVIGQYSAGSRNKESLTGIQLVSLDEYAYAIPNVP